MNPLDIMKNLKDVQERMQAAQGRIQAMEVEGSAGGGMVKVTMNGTFQVRQVWIDPALANPEDFVMVGDLFVAACRDAHGKISAGIQQEMQAATGGMPLPPMFGNGF